MRRGIRRAGRRSSLVGGNVTANGLHAWVLSGSEGRPAILLRFGPGEAKGELTKRLESKGLKERLVGTETVDKVTVRQIAARVREFYRPVAHNAHGAKL